VPDGVPPALVALAVKVTACPTSLGLREEVKVVDVLLRLTPCWVVPELPLSLTSPL